MKSLLPVGITGISRRFVGQAMCGLLLTVGTVHSLEAQTILASGQLSATPGTPGTWNYSMIISDAAGATSGIGSFWYAWIPGQFYLPSSPSSVTAPTGWTANIVPGFGAYSIQFAASSAAYDIAPGSSLTFNFVSTDSPTTLAGNAASYPTTPIGTTVAYGAGFFSSPSETFVVQSVPEPSSLAFMLAGGLALVGFCGFRRQSHTLALQKTNQG